MEYHTPDASRSGAPDEPAVSHLKMTLVDGRFLVLGSGNMDRASWFTSQELGMLFHSVNGFAEWEEEAWDGPLATRVRPA
jgi:phosphatidylserine/phosphatidylglycerophosphate/cardiolipin synthase-like enzyme